ncbi:MAG: molybdopterin-binding protein, partial [Anaerolineae bacterium]
MRVAVLTISDRTWRGEAEDTSGPLIADIVRNQLNATVTQQHVVPDEGPLIAETLRAWCDDG